jgi:predicted RNA-binding protein with RPS1 domain
MPSILTIKHKEVEDAMNAMNQKYQDSIAQLNKTKDEGFKTLESKLKDEADYQKNTLLNAYKDMNDLPKE